MKTNQLLTALLLLAALSSSAQMLSWQWAYGASGNIEAQGTNIKTDPSGNVYAFGNFSGKVLGLGNDTILDSDTGGYAENFYLVKYSSGGAVMWSKGIGDGINYMNNPVMTTDAFGNVIVGGSFGGDFLTFGYDTLYNQDSLGQYEPFFLVEYNSAGNVVWAKTGDSTISLSAISTDAAGNIYATGELIDTTAVWGSTTLTNAGYTNAILGKFDASGNALWARRFGGNWYDKGGAVSLDAAGNSYVTGIYTSKIITSGPVTLTDSNEYNFVFILKYDSSGNIIWGQSVSNSSGTLNNNIAADASGNVYITGTINGDDTLNFGSITLANPETAGYGDVFIAKYNSAGNALWAKCPQTNDEATGNAITIGGNGNVYLAGSFSDTTIVFGSQTLHNPDTVDNQPEALFIAALDTSGNAIWLAEAGSSHREGNYSNDIAADAEGNAYITGFFYDSLLVFGNDSLMGSTVDEGQTLFIAKYGSNISGIHNISPAAGNVLVYPNPSTGQFNFKGVTSGSTLQVYDLLGQNIYSAVVNSNNYSLNIAGKAKGVYLYRVTGDDAVIQQGKIVLE